LREGALWESHPEADCAAPSALAHLLGLDQPYLLHEAELRGLCPEALRSSLNAHAGLRIVRLPLGEALLCFLCSPLKRIAQIKQALDAVAEAFGPELSCGLRALPDWQTLAGVTEAGLRACRLGFRAKAIVRTAARLSASPGFLDRLAALPYEDARRELMTLPGVGGKIADCALLYSGTCALEPFPADTWITRAMNRLHGTGLDSPEKAAALGRSTYGRVAGLAQQHMFIAARKGLWE
jgi:N-glycosylase/DNA lyase